MKNLFKNLMLVAVAAMAFTACQNDNNEVNEVNRVTRYEFTANIADENDDTRSGFVGKNEAGNAYVSEWEGNETLKIFVTNYSSYNVETTAPINAEGFFELELTDAPESFFMTVVSPAESWESENTANIPAVQTPLANSVDPKAHLLQAQAVPVSGGVADINMTHMAAYGKMTVNGVAFEIDHVVVDLKGSYYGYAREYSYTINADNVENNTFWFATEPIDVAEFTVTAYDAEGIAVAKTVDVAEAGKTMSFAYGRVGTFSVSGLEAPAEPEAPAKVFTSAEVSTAYDLNDYEICFKDQEGKEFYVEFYYEDGTYVIENDILKEGTYVLDEFDGSNGLYYVDYDGIGFSCATVIVSHVEGLYNIQFTNLKKWNWNSGAWTDVPFEEAVYTGGITGLSNPDGSAPTPTPDPDEPGSGDDDYDDTGLPIYNTAYCSSEYGQDRYVYFQSADASLKELRIDFNGVFDTTLNTIKPGVYSEDDYSLYPNYNTYGGYKVKDLTVTVSYVADGYRIVFENVVDASTGNLIFEKAVFVGFIESLGDVSTAPKMILSADLLTFSPVAGSAELNVTFKNYSGAIEASSNNPHFTTSVDGSKVTVTAAENTTDKEIEGVITITSGELSAIVNVIQKAAGDTSADGKTLETAYTFTTYSVRYDGGYPVMQFSGSEDNAFFELESNSSSSYPTGRQYMNSGNWWTSVHQYTVNGTNYNIDLSKSMTWLESSGLYYTLEYLYIVPEGKTEGVFYKYNGKFTF